MLETVRPGESTEVWPSNPESVSVLEPPLSLDRLGADGARPVARTLILPTLTAVMLHAGLALAVLALPEDLVGSAGSDFDAISVEVSIVPGSALESRAKDATSDTEASAALSQVEGNAEATAADVAETAPEPPPEPVRKAVTEPETPPDEPLREPPRQTATIVVPEPDPALPDEAAPVLPVARQPSSQDPVEPPAPETKAEPSPPIVEREPPPPEPLREEVQPKPAEERKADSPPSVAAAAGGAASSSVGTVTRPSRAAVAASPGAVRAFSRQVAAALSRSRPRPSATRSRGTTLIAFAISEGGRLEFVRIARSSGDGVLDNAALAAVRKANLPSPPPGLTLKQRTYEMPYHFR
jgi:protein TonB